MIGPKPVKVLKREPKPHEWISFGIHEMKGRRNAQPAKVRNLLGRLVVRTGLGYLGTARSSRSSGREAKPELD